ncbi:hypothetical protein GALL_412830 [mine drainage metagenome]|uniref:Uncharacterized protein n=1 Tax=mine drainage metagenome TaxID=410659 RepID=A0A1J5QAU9_9ZZZZ
MRLGETEVGEGLELVEDLLRDVGRDAVASHPGEQPRVERLHALGGPLGPHGSAQLVGLGRGEVRHVNRHLHELFLEQRDAERLGQGLLQPRVQVRDLLPATRALDVGVHRAALDGSGPDERDLHHDVVEATRLEPGQRRHLRAGLHLEDPDGVRGAQEVVHEGVLVREPVQPELHTLVLTHQVEGDPQRREHPQPQQVELHQPGVGAVVLVPLEHRATGHPRPLHRAHLDHRPVAQHHAAGVDAQVPGQAQHPLREVDYGRGDLVELAGRRRLHRGDDVVAVGGRGRRRRGRRPSQAPPPLDRPAPGVLLPDVVPERPRGVPHRGARPVGDHVGNLRRVLTVEAFVDVLDDLLAAPRLDVDVDVRRPVPLRCQEALEEQAVRDGVHRGDPERVADRRVRRRPAPLAEDPAPTAEVHEVVDDQEVPRETEGLDHVELVGDLRVRAGDPLGCRLPVAVEGTSAHQLTQPGGLGVPRRDGVGRQARGDEGQVERALVAEHRRGPHRLRVPTVPDRHLGRRAQVGRRGPRQPPVHVVERGTCPHGRERGREIGVPRAGVVDVAGRDQRQPGTGRERSQRVAAFGVQRVPGVGDLDGDVLPAEQRDQPVQLGPGRHGGIGAAAVQGLTHRTLATAGQDQPLPGRLLGEMLEPVVGSTLGPGRQVGLGDRPGQRAVAVGPAGQHQQMGGTGVRDTRRRVQQTRRGG